MSLKDSKVLNNLKERNSDEKTLAEIKEELVNNSINFKIKFDVLKLEENSHKGHNHDDQDHIEQDRISRNKVRAKSMDMFNLGIKNASGTNISELFK
jgi:hypothetical protein